MVPIDSAYVESGTSLGSPENGFIKPAARAPGLGPADLDRCRPGGPATCSNGGSARRSTTVRTASLGRVDFADYDVLVLPSGNYAGQISDAVLTRVKDWLRLGGTLVTLADATRWAVGSGVGLLDTNAAAQGRPARYPGDDRTGAVRRRSGAARRAPRRRRPPLRAYAPTGAVASAAGHAHRRRDVPTPRAGPDPGDPEPRVPAMSTFDKAIQPERERPDAQPGALLRATVDTDHWLSAGSDGETQVVIEGSRVFAPIKLNAGRNVVYYGQKASLVASGLIWPEGQDLLVRKPYLMHQPFGQGHVIAFAEDPNYRAYTEATMLLFMNAVLLRPAY